MFQGVDECFIIEHGLIVSFLLLFDLLHEEIFLEERIVEFGVGVTELVVVDEELESLGESWFCPVVFGQWRHHLRMFDNKGWVQTLGLEETSDQLVNQSYRRSGV